MNTIPHWLTKQSYLAPHQIAIETDHGETMTFSELQRASEMFAKKLARLGVKRESHIGLYSTNDPHMIVAIHALSYLGAVTVMLNTRLTKSELDFQIHDAQVSFIITSDDLMTHAEDMQFSVPVYSFSHVHMLEKTKASIKTQLNLNDLFTIMYTSGTTGKPKGVMHTYGNHWWSAIGSALNLGLKSQDKWLAVLPIFHVGGLSICIRSVIYGMPIYLLKKFNATVINKAIIEKGVTIASVVTVMLQELVADLGETSYPQSFRCMLLGGGPCPKHILEQSYVKHIPVFQSYGMTETSSQIVTLSPADAFHKIGSSGKPLFPGQLKINNPDVHGVGEILVKGPMVTSGYFNYDEANKNAFNNGWLCTGDLGYLDDDGFLYVVDRRNDLIISGGENIYPSEIESVLAGMSEILEVGVVGKSDQTWGEIPVAFVVTEDHTLQDEDIKNFGSKYLASYKVPKEIYFVKRLPRNATNKLMRHVLVKWIEEDTLGGNVYDR